MGRDGNEGFVWNVWVIVVVVEREALGYARSV